MNSLLNFGKSMLNKKGDGGGDNSNNSSSIFGKFGKFKATAAKQLN